MRGTDYTVEIVTSAQRFAALADPWDRLAKHAGSPLCRHGWYLAALEASSEHSHQELETVLLWDGPELAAAAPLLCRTRSGLARLVAIDRFAGEPSRLPCLGEPALAALARACAERRKPIVFDRLEMTGGARSCLVEGLRRNAHVDCRNRHSSARAVIPADFAQLERSMSASRRSSIRRKWRRAARDHGGIEASFARPDAHAIDSELARFEAIEGSGWKGAAGTALTRDTRMSSFITRLAHTFARENALIIGYLTIGGRDAASRLILEQDSGWFEIKIGFDEAFARYSPGILLMHETLREACRCGIDRYAYLGLFEDWQKAWPHEVVEDFRLATYPYSPSGALAFCSDVAQAAVSSLGRYIRT